MFPKDINEHTYEAYFETLSPFKIEYVEEAARHFLREAIFFPLPVDFKNRLHAIAWNDAVWAQVREPLLEAAPEVPIKKDESEQLKREK